MKLSTLRIIGGKWRSRKINFIPLKGVRPTTDLVRETIFNWLSPVIVGANCLDLFAGSGALGFEALSRGAKHVVLVDQSTKIVKQLKASAKLLQADNVDFYCAAIPGRLNKIPAQTFDLVFLDPPFHYNLIQPTCAKLLNGGYLSKGSYIYIEAEKAFDIASLIPQSWQILRTKPYGLGSGFLLHF